jgi:putative hydrolase of the HAD superfamily
MTSRKFRAVIFDLDDTLYRENDFVLSGFRAVGKWALQTLSIPEEDGLAYLSYLHSQGIRGNTLNRWLAYYGHLDPVLLNDAIEVYRNHVPKIRLFPEAAVLLPRLREEFLLGIVSDGALRSQQNKIIALGLNDMIDAVVLSDVWGRDFWKPSTRPFLEVLQILGVDSSEAIYIGDNPVKDFLGARRSGIATAWVRRASGEYRHEEPPTPEHRADWCIPSLDDVWRILHT